MLFTLLLEKLRCEFLRVILRWNISNISFTLVLMGKNYIDGSGFSAGRKKWEWLRSHAITQ